MSISQNTFHALMQILMIGLSGRGKKDLKDADLNEAMRIASAHGLSAIAVDGLEKALDCHPEWRNEVPTLMFLQFYNGMGNSLFFDIIRNRRNYSRFGYCSMERFYSALFGRTSFIKRWCFKESNPLHSNEAFDSLKKVWRM